MNSLKMKKLFYLTLALTLFLSSCDSKGTNDEKGEVISKWELIETRVSPGGIVEFTPAEEEEIIEFLEGFKVRNSNGWCGDEDKDVVTHSEEGEIFPECPSGGTLLFEIEGDIMIMRGSTCIESCDYKYKRIK